MFIHRRWIGGVLLVPLILIFIIAGTAYTQSSPNYRIIKSVIDQGGAPSHSSNHNLVDAVGQPSAIGPSGSASYRIAAGFFTGGFGVQEETVIYDFPQQGWYLISLPVIPPDNKLGVLFPTALGAFAYDPNSGNYVPVSALDPTIGYWLLIPSPVTATISGAPLTIITEHYPSGWHLIGTVIITTPFTDPDDNPNGAVIGAYGWNINAGQYYPVFPPGTGKLEPMQGYWLAVIQACDLTIGGAGAASTDIIAKGNIQSFQNQFGSQPPDPPFLKDRSIAQLLPITEMTSRNFPNPFNPETVIEYALPNAGLTQLHIYNALGQRIRTLLEQEQLRGIYRVIWDGRDDDGNLATNGIYFYRIINSGTMETRKMLLLK